jgi:two-component system sensor histidine kinase TorS
MHDFRVLVVEDDNFGAQVVEYLLESRQITVQVAGTVQQALACLEQQRFDLAVIDLALPDADGWELLRRIRNAPHTATLPCVAITAFHDSHVAQQAHRAGFIDYFPKPLLTSFGRAIENLLMLRR